MREWLGKLDIGFKHLWIPVVGLSGLMAIFSFNTPSCIFFLGLGIGLVFANRMADVKSQQTQIQLKLALAESRFHEEVFSSAFEYSSGGKALVSPDGQWLRVNEAICRMVGYSREELLQINFQKITFQDDLEKDLGFVQKMLKGEIDTYHIEKRYIRKDGRIIWVKLGVSLVHNADGSPKFFISQIDDITDAKKAKEELQKSNRELERSNKDLEHFASIASHDLQEPIRTIAAFAGLLEEQLKDKLNDNLKTHINCISEAAKRMQTLIKGLLSYSRASSKVIRLTSVDTNEILIESLANLKQRISDSHAQIHYPEYLPQVEGDRSQLIQVFQNLIANGIKFCPKDKDPEIKIDFKQHDGGIEFCISDNGIGIKADYYDKIFLMFQRLNTVEEFEGSGLGLALCKKIIERHGGKIWVKSTPGVGSQFFFGPLVASNGS